MKSTDNDPITDEQNGVQGTAYQIHGLPRGVSDSFPQGSDDDQRHTGTALLFVRHSFDASRVVLEIGQLDRGGQSRLGSERDPEIVQAIGIVPLPRMVLGTREGIKKRRLM